MAILETVKQALGIYYSEPTKDAEITRIINGAKAYFEAAGCPSADLAEGDESDLAVEAIITYAKMAINTDPLELRHNPVLLAMIIQMRTVSTLSESEETDENSD